MTNETTQEFLTRQREFLAFVNEQALSLPVKIAIDDFSQLLTLAEDTERLNWLADPDNIIGNVQLPVDCVLNNPHSLRAAIDEAMSLTNE